MKRPLIAGGAVAVVGVLAVLVCVALGFYNVPEGEGAASGASADASRSTSSASASSASSESTGSASSASSASDASDAADAEVLNGIPFSTVQLYKGALYVGSVRTARGLEPVTSIAGTRQTPVQADQFVFADGSYYYIEGLAAEPAEGAEGAEGAPAASKLHAYNLTSGFDKVLVQDVMPSTRLYYADGSIVYQSTDKNGASIKVVDADTGRASELDFSKADGTLALRGVVDGKAIVASSRADQKNRVYACALEDGTAREVISFSSNEALCAVCDDMLITANKNTLTGYDVDGDQVWSLQLPAEHVDVNSVYVDEGVLYFATGPAGSPQTVMAVEAASGVSEKFPTQIASSLVVIYTDGKTLYFCDVAVPQPENAGQGGGEGASGESAERGYASYGVKLSDGTVTKLDIQNERN